MMVRSCKTCGFARMKRKMLAIVEQVDKRDLKEAEIQESRELTCGCTEKNWIGECRWVDITVID